MPIVDVYAPAEASRYPIVIAPDLLHACEGHLSILAGRRALLVTDTHVAPLYACALEDALSAAGCAVSRAVVPAGEPSKSPQMLSVLYEHLVEQRITRKDAVIALGGGVVGDLAGYAAATFMRGVRFIQVPTTLLAQVDSSVGGKVAVNHPRGKNLLGTFYQPDRVLIDTSTLRTLDARQFGAGLGEVIKYGCIADQAFFEQLEAWGSREALTSHLPEIVARCCQIKARYVEQDPLDHGVRCHLNYGHTLAHAVETLSGYGVVLHGEAVCMGLVATAGWGEQLGCTPIGTQARIRQLLEAYDLPTRTPSGLSKDDLLHAMSMDKKGEGDAVNLVLLPRIGACTSEHVSLSTLRTLL